MRDLDDPTFTRKHHVENGVLVLEDEKPNAGPYSSKTENLVG